MTTARKQYSPKFKARAAVEAIRGEKTLSPLGSQFKVHPIQIAKWRKSALEHWFIKPAAVRFSGRVAVLPGLSVVP